MRTALKAVIKAAEHEVREAFRHKGRAVYSPHYDMERLGDPLYAGGAGPPSGLATPHFVRWFRDKGLRLGINWYDV